MAKYFIGSADRQGSCYYEFYVGTWDRKKMQFWHKDSICITDYDWSSTGFESLVADIVDGYDPYGYTAVTKEQWNTLLQKAEAAGGELQAAVTEVTEWAKQNFLRHKVFTILGM
jgi:hypothetical protein